MAISYIKEERVSIGELAKSFNLYVNKLKNKTINKIAIIKNNKPEAVIIPIEEYERLEELDNLIEHISIAQTIENRVPNGKFEGGFDYESYRQKRLKSV